MLNNIQNQVLALAGIYQACQQVKTLGWNGTCDAHDFNTSLQSILKIDAANVIDVYGNIENLTNGLQGIAQHLNKTSSNLDREVLNYLMTLLVLQKKLLKKPTMLDSMKTSIENITEQLAYFDITHTNTITKFAELYKQTISQISPKILVNGDRNHLSNEETASKIRALLLAGMRSAVLWKQCGGSRLKLLLQRQQYYAAVKTLV